MLRITDQAERRALQVTLCLLAVVPIGAGLAGALIGLASPGAGAGRAAAILDSHYRYLSGLLLAIGVLYMGLVPRIECRGGAIRMLTAAVVTGGSVRLLGLLEAPHPDPVVVFALAMELLVAPALALWQARVASRVRAGARR
ncbi:MAG: DUF4345 domain-containing protein [Hyphomicrobiaceae bacterium]|nr:DUF4345 domain-containing protein [Hyphomicrobiaceae bacterium]